MRVHHRDGVRRATSTKPVFHNDGLRTTAAAAAAAPARMSTHAYVDTDMSESHCTRADQWPVGSET